MAHRGESVIRRAYIAFAERDLEALRAIADESIEISTVTGLLAGRSGPYVGHQGLAEYMGDLAGTWKRLELRPQQFQAIDDESILVFGRVRAWHESGGGFLDSANAWLWTVRDGRIVAVKVFADPGEARAAFGDLLSG
jgi:ketosteroid isomerase-like protein